MRWSISSIIALMEGRQCATSSSRSIIWRSFINKFVYGSYQKMSYSLYDKAYLETCENIQLTNFGLDQDVNSRFLFDFQFVLWFWARRQFWFAQVFVPGAFYHEYEQVFSKAEKTVKSSAFCETMKLSLFLDIFMVKILWVLHIYRPFHINYLIYV